MSEGSDLNWPVNKAGLAAGETLYSYDSEITARVQDIEVRAKRPELTPLIWRLVRGRPRIPPNYVLFRTVMK